MNDSAAYGGVVRFINTPAKVSANDPAYLMTVILTLFMNLPAVILQT